eukprot:5731211-Prymnesium_polylepis.1
METCEDASEEGGDAAAQPDSDEDTPDGTRRAHASCHIDFVDFVRKTFGDAALAAGGVLDIAGGRGAV